MEPKERNALYFIKNKINSNKDLLNSLQDIYEDEKKTGALANKKEKNKDKFDRYLSACLFNEYSIINLPVLGSVFFIISLFCQPKIDLPGLLFVPVFFLATLDTLLGSYKHQQNKEGFLKYSKKVIKSSFSSLLNKKNSLGRKKYELYGNEISLRSLEEIAKYISKEEMSVILKAKLDYESLNIYKDKLTKEKEYADINKYIENDLNINTVRNNLIENIYKDKGL